MGTLSSVYGDTLSECLLQNIKLPCSILRRIFSMDFNNGDRVFYTRSNGMQVHATVVGTAKDGVLYFEHYQDGVHYGLWQDIASIRTSYASPKVGRFPCGIRKLHGLKKCL